MFEKGPGGGGVNQSVAFDCLEADPPAKLGPIAEIREDNSQTTCAGGVMSKLYWGITPGAPRAHRGKLGRFGLFGSALQIQRRNTTSPPKPSIETPDNEREGRPRKGWSFAILGVGERKRNFVSSKCYGGVHGGEVAAVVNALTLRAEAKRYDGLFGHDGRAPH